MRIRTGLLASLALGVLIAPFSINVARAQGTVEIGTLTCIGGEGVGLIIGSKKTYACTFTPTGGARPERYMASITKIGLDVGATGKTTMVWTVLSATQAKRAGVLSGSYAGAAADVAVGVGGGAKLLVGGSNKAITLQPLSVQGQTGLNLAVGVAGMTLSRK